jgi:PAS domain S-box-containing protein
MPALLTNFLNALGLRRAGELEREISHRKEAEAALKTTLVQLLHAVATTANQALDFEDALQACLDLVCVHIHWPVGHVYLANPHDQSQLVPTTFWHLDEVAKFEPFRQATLCNPLRINEGSAALVRAAGQPVWLEHLGANPNFCRAEAARSAGLRTGLACPVLVGMEVVAILEFFTTEAVPADDAFLIAMSHVGTQLSRVIERGRAREALQESEARFRSVAQSAHEAIISADHQGTMLFWNKGAEAMFGYQEDEVLGRPLTMLMPERYREAHQAALSQSTDGKNSRVIGRTREFHGLRKNGTEFPLELSLARWRTGKGTFFSGIIRDITARKRAEESLRMSEAMFKGLFGSAPDALVVVNHDGKIFRINRQAEKMFGYRENDLLGEYVEILLPERFRERHVQLRSSYLADPRPRDMINRLELYGRHKDGREFPVDIMLGPLKGETHLLVLATIRDITERKRAEEELRRARDQLETRVAERTTELACANRSLKASLKEKEMLLREVHHRVKNNLQVISSLLSIQSSRIKDRHALTVFKESQNRVKTIAAIHQKLVRSSDLAHINIADYIRNLVESLLRSYGVDDGAVQLQIDVDDLQLGIDTAIPCALIINELVTNSLKHAFPGGRRGQLGVELRANGAEDFHLTVRDDGAGADFSIDNVESVGLQIVKALTEQLDGSLDVTTGHGTAFHIHFKELRYGERR